MNIFTWLFGEKRDVSYRQIQHDFIKEQKKLENESKQAHFDMETEIRCREEVRRYFEQYKASKAQFDYFASQAISEFQKAYFNSGFIYLRDWNRGIYMIYDEETAKFKEQGSLDKFRNDYFQELKQLNNIE